MAPEFGIDTVMPGFMLMMDQNNWNPNRLKPTPRAVVDAMTLTFVIIVVSSYRFKEINAGLSVEVSIVLMVSLTSFAFPWLRWCG